MGINDFPTEDDVRCLVMWPENTVGYNREYEVILKLLSMCREHGFGRIPQIASQIEALWRNPEKKIEFLERQKEQVEFLKKCGLIDINRRS